MNASSHKHKLYLLCFLLVLGARMVNAQIIQKVGVDLAERVLDRLKTYKSKGDIRIFPAMFFDTDTTKTKLGTQLNRAFRDRLRGLISESDRLRRFKVVSADREDGYLDEQAYQYLVTPSSKEENEELQKRLQGMVPHYFVRGKYELRSGHLVITSLYLKANPYISVENPDDIELITDGNNAFRLDDRMAAQLQDMNQPIGLAGLKYSSQFFDFLYKAKRKQNKALVDNYQLSLMSRNANGMLESTNHLVRNREYKIKISLSALAPLTYLHVIQFEKQYSDNKIAIYPLYPIDQGTPSSVSAPNDFILPNTYELNSQTPDLIQFVVIATNSPLPTNVQKRNLLPDGSFEPTMDEANYKVLLDHLRGLNPDNYALVHKEVAVTY